MNLTQVESKSSVQDDVFVISRSKLQSLKETELTMAKRMEKEGKMLTATEHYGAARLLTELLEA